MRNLAFLCLVVLIAATAQAQRRDMQVVLPDPIPMGTTRGESVARLVVRNATVVSGRGSPRTNRAMPPEGPVDIVIENGRIVNMIPVDPVNAAGYREGQRQSSGDREIDASGMYVIPGLVDMHVHLRPNGGELGERALEYQYLLYMGHGVTTLRDAGTGAGIERMTEERRRSAANEIVAPRLILCQRWPLPLRQWDVGHTPESAREMVRRFHELGADCVKVSKSPGHYPDVLRAIVEEGETLGLSVMVDLKVSETDAVTASLSGVRSIEHWYGVPDAALPHTQNFPEDYNYWDELDRFRWAGALWAEAAQYPEALSEVIDTMIANGTNWDPTMVVYEANRDLARARTFPWLETLGHPAAVRGLWPDPSTHGAYHTEWKTSDEVRWKENFAIWMRYVKEFHEKGGLLTAGSDTSPWGGIALIRELELLQEAGLHPIDVIRVATTNAYQALGLDEHCGIRVGCVADLVVVNGNPIDNLKVLYGFGYGFYGIVDPSEQWKQ
ncbi:MAG TPA: amidohydrolase family protein, partial [Vicinamibacteria bacterium]|nr:amidohydrolase family protein [Vicinamibacteria bacterium]